MHHRPELRQRSHKLHRRLQSSSFILHPSSFIRLGIVLVIPALVGLVWAQGPKARSGAARKQAVKLPASAPAEEAAKAAPKTLELPAVTLSDPAVEAVLQTKPSTPSERVRAGKVLADLKRPDLAQAQFREVLAANPDAKQLAALAEEFGSELFVQIGSRPELAPEGRRLADAVLAARAQQLQDPQRLKALIEKLRDPSVETQAQAVIGLREAGVAAVGPLLAVLADPGRAAEYPGVRAALAALGPEVYGPLAAVLEAPDPKLNVEAIRVLASLPARSTSLLLLRPCYQEGVDSTVRTAAQAAARQLWRYLPQRDEAADRLADLSKRYARGVEPLAADASGRVLIWTWDSEKKQAVARPLSSADAYRWLAARFARDAYAIMPSHGKMLRLHLVTALEQASYENGLDKPLRLDKGTIAGKAAALGAEVVEDVLAYAMRDGHDAAATAAARILGQMPEAGRLLNRSAEPCPLALATRHADRRLRLAAVEALVRIEPAGPYPGASYLPEALGFMAASTGVRRALIGAPSLEQSVEWGANLATLGYEAEVATTGRDLVRKALASPDYELILADATLSYPTLDFVLQSLRRDGRTALLPVGVLARAEDLQRARHLVRNDPRAAAFSRPHTPEAARWQVEQLLARSGDTLSARQRMDHAALALDWLGQLSVLPRRGLYDLSRIQDTVLGALEVPELASRAAAVLGRLGTPEAQVALVELASRTTAPLAARRAALDAFRNAVERYGIQLTAAQIRLQYDRYNQSARLDAATQAVLGMILDSIEAPTKTRGQSRQKSAISYQPSAVGHPPSAVSRQP